MAETRQFMRSHPDATGVHRVSIAKDTIKIEGREVYQTSKQKEIDVLENDEALEEVGEYESEETINIDVNEE